MKETNENTSVNSVYTDGESLLRWGRLEYDPSLLHEGEKYTIKENWDGEAILVHHYKLLKVGTHNGQHHLDEVFCLALLKELGFHCLNPSCSRNPRDWDEEHLVVDVGEGLLDHHGKRAAEGISAATRVFLLLRNTFYIPSDKFRWLKWADLTVKVAAIDTGLLDPKLSPFPWVHTALRAGAIRGTPEGDLLNQVSDDLVNQLNEVKSIEWVERREKEEEVCEKAASAASDAITVAIKDAGMDGVPVFPMEARWGETKKALWTSTNTCPYYIGQELDGSWRVLCSAPKGGEFSPTLSMRLIPPQYRGLNGESLSQKTGIKDGVFSHAGGFIAGFRSLDSAKAFAKLCLGECLGKEGLR